METPLAQVLRRLMDQYHHNGPRRLAKQSGVPEKTIEKWLGGEVSRPRTWQDLVKVAAALHVGATEADQLLLAAGHKPLAQLQDDATAEADKNLFHIWRTTSTLPLQVPFQAIPDLHNFVGRERELAEVKRLVCDGHHVAVCSFQGMGGVGKTALAAHIAYELRSHFQDGVLWIRVDVSTPLVNLETIARSLGEDVSQIRDLDNRSSFVRGLLAKKRVLLVLDNASASEQVRPLLPSNNGASAAIITTRYDLTVVDDLYRVEILPFTVEQGEALALFTHTLGESYVQRYDKQLLEIAEHLGHLPLALSITASRIRQHRTHALEPFLAEIRNSEQRLALLAREDRSVRLSFDLSYQLLADELQSTFDRLGVFGGEDVSLEAIAFVNKLSIPEASRQLEKLRKSSLVQESRNRRYRLHPLLYSYAGEHLAIQEWVENNNPFVRMLTYFASFVEQNKSDYVALDSELSNLLAAHEIAQQRQYDELLLRQAVALFPYLELRGLYEIAERQMQVAQISARQIGDELAYATSLFYMGMIRMRRSEYIGPIEIYQNALQIAQRLGEHMLATRIEKTISSCYFSLGDYTTAETHAQAALTYARQSGDLVLLSETHVALGVILQHRGELSTSTMHIRSSIEFARQAKEPRWLVLGLLNLGEMLAVHGDLDGAESYLTEALQLARMMRYQERISNLLVLLGNVFRQRHNLTQAYSVIMEGLVTARQIGHRWVTSAALIEQGFVLSAQGHLENALTSFKEAHTIATEIQAQHYIGDSLYGMAQIAYTKRQQQEAEQLGEQSLVILESIGYFKAKEVSAWLMAVRSVANGDPR